MAMGSETMGDKNRMLVHLIAVSSSLILHVLVRPYKDKMGNIAVVLFCIVDLLGIVAGKNIVIQTIFIVTTLVTLILVLFVAVKATIKTHHDKKLKAFNTGKKAKAEFTRLESILLWPVFLLLLWPRKLIVHIIINIFPFREQDGVYTPPRYCTFHVLCCRTNSHIEHALQEHFQQNGGSNQAKNWNLMRNGHTKILPKKSISSDLSEIDEKLNRARAAVKKGVAQVNRLQKQRALMLKRRDENAPSPPTKENAPSPPTKENAPSSSTSAAPEKKKLFRTKTAIDL